MNMCFCFFCFTLDCRDKTKHLFNYRNVAWRSLSIFNNNVFDYKIMFLIIYVHSACNVIYLLIFFITEAGEVNSFSLQ